MYPGCRWQPLAPWPRGLVSANLFASLDGSTVRLYGQWTDDDSYQQYTRTHRHSMAAEIDAAVPGIERRAAVNYRLYRSATSGGNR